jgi:hypothetical protein
VSLVGGGLAFVCGATIEYDQGTFSAVCESAKSSELICRLWPFVIGGKQEAKMPGDPLGLAKTNLRNRLWKSAELAALRHGMRFKRQCKAHVMDFIDVGVFSDC